MSILSQSIVFVTAEDLSEGSFGMNHGYKAQGNRYFAHLLTFSYYLLIITSVNIAYHHHHPLVNNITETVFIHQTTT